MNETTISLVTIFADRLKIALSTSGITKSQLCRMVDMSRSALTGYLHAEYLPKKDRLAKIADALNVSAQWLMGFDVPMAKGALIGTSVLSKGFSTSADELEKARNAVRFIPIVNIDSLDDISLSELAEDPSAIIGYIPYCFGADDNTDSIICIKLDSENPLINTCMMPCLMPGDIVFADTGAQPEIDDIVLIDNCIDPGVFCIYTGRKKSCFTFPGETPMAEFVHSRSKIMAVVTGIIRKAVPVNREINWFCPETEESLAVARDGSGQLSSPPDDENNTKFQTIGSQEGY